MKNMSNNELIEWLRDHISEDGSIETASYADQLTIIHLKGQTCQLPDSWGHANCHISLQLYSGELRLMVNSLRVGFESPTLIDFIMGYDWKNMDLLNDFQAYILLSKHEFFMNSTARLRSKIADLMLHFAEHPFVQLERDRGLPPEATHGIALFLAERHQQSPADRTNTNVAMCYRM